jgi:hypothetical protein
VEKWARLGSNQRPLACETEESHSRTELKPLQTTHFEFNVTSEPSGENAARVRHGDIVVVDSPPPPTSKDQCKNGGYQYGFRDRGQCNRTPDSYAPARAKNAR